MTGAIYFINATSINCYQGGLEIFTTTGEENYFYKLIVEFDFIYNILFNFGYMWTDMVMILLGTPYNTAEPYPYYLAFYLGDFMFRFIFRAESDVNCWYPWNNCLTSA